MEKLKRQIEHVALLLNTEERSWLEIEKDLECSRHLSYDSKHIKNFLSAPESYIFLTQKCNHILSSSLLFSLWLVSSARCQSTWHVLTSLIPELNIKPAPYINLPTMYQNYKNIWFICDHIRLSQELTITEIISLNCLLIIIISDELVQHLCLYVQTQ